MPDHVATPVLRRLLIWTLICAVSAAPSFVVAWSLFDELRHAAAMLLGIACFIVGYTIVSGWPVAGRLRRHPHARVAIYSGYTTRILISAIYPVGLFVDIWCGAAAASLGEMLPLPAESAVIVFATTIIQGLILNVVLALYMLVIYGAQRLLRGRPPAPGSCVRCGYDLRASAEVCPECGTAVRSVGGQSARRAA